MAPASWLHWELAWLGLSGGLAPEVALLLGCMPTALGGFILPNLGGGSHASMGLLGRGCHTPPPPLDLGSSTLVWTEVVWLVKTQEMSCVGLEKLRRQL